MIKTFNFEDAHAMSVLHPSSFQIPSKEQIRRLRLGDFAQVCANGERFWARIIYIRGTDIIAVVDNELVMDALQLGDTIAFTTFNIYKITPGDHSKEPIESWYMCVSGGKQPTIMVLHTKFPRFLAKVIFAEKEVKIKDVMLFDEPLNYAEDMPALLKAGSIWFFENHVKNK